MFRGTNECWVHLFHCEWKKDTHPVKTRHTHNALLPCSLLHEVCHLHLILAQAIGDMRRTSVDQTQHQHLRPICLLTFIRQYFTPNLHLSFHSCPPEPVRTNNPRPGKAGDVDTELLKFLLSCHKFPLLSSPIWSLCCRYEERVIPYSSETSFLLNMFCITLGPWRPVTCRVSTFTWASHKQDSSCRYTKQYILCVIFDI